MQTGLAVVLARNAGFRMEDTSTSVKLVEFCVKMSSLGMFSSVRHWMKPSEVAEDGVQR
jgi:hypothetical protein